MGRKMPWGKIDDRAWQHVRFDGVSLRAYGFFWAAISYSNAKLLDGLLTPAHLNQLMGYRQARAEDVSELVEAGLWLKVPAGYQIHDYLQYNDSKVEILERRRENAEAQERWRERQRHKPPDNGITNGIGNPITNEHVPVPGSPVPGTRLPGTGEPAARNPLPTRPHERPTAVRQNGGTRAVDRSSLAHTRDYAKMIAERGAREGSPDAAHQNPP